MLKSETKLQLQTIDSRSSEMVWVYTTLGWRFEYTSLSHTPVDQNDTKLSTQSLNDTITDADTKWLNFKAEALASITKVKDNNLAFDVKSKANDLVACCP